MKTSPRTSYTFVLPSLIAVGLLTLGITASSAADMPVAGATQSPGVEPTSPFANANEAATWKWFLERAGREQHIERDGQGRVKWVGFLNATKPQGDYYAGSFELDAEARVVKLTCDAPHLTNDDLKKLAALGKLRSLTAWHNGWVKSDDKRPYSGEGLAHLTELPLAEVNFGGSWFNDDGLAAAAKLPHLSELQVYHTRITNAGLRHLRGNDHLRKLVIGPQFSQNISEAALADIATLTKLEELHFNETILTWDGGLKLLAESHQPLKLLKFDQGLSDEGDLKRLQTALPDVKIEYTDAKPEHAEQMRKAAAEKK